MDSLHHVNSISILHVFVCCLCVKQQNNLLRSYS